MATRTPNRTTTRKSTDAKTGSAGKSGVADKAAKKEKAPAAAPAPPVPPPAPKETVSLIDEKPKTPRRRATPSSDMKAFKVLPSISRILESEQPKPWGELEVLAHDPYRCILRQRDDEARVQHAPETLADDQP